MASEAADLAGEPNVVDEQTLRARVTELQQALESGDRKRADLLLDDITRIRESTLFREMGAITRQLHETLVGLNLDPRIALLCEQAIPDAKARLDFVIQKTETAAHRTLSAVEEALPLCSSLLEQSTRLGESWRSFQRRELSPDEFHALTREMDDFLGRVRRDTTLLNEKLSEVLMAQDFQDLTGQVIRRVVDVVQEVQGHLVDLVRTKRPKTPESGREPPPRGNDRLKGEGPQVGAARAANVVQSQDEVDDLLSSLGF